MQHRLAHLIELLLAQLRLPAPGRAQLVDAEIKSQVIVDIEQDLELILELVGLPVLQTIGASYLRLTVDCYSFLPLLDALIADTGDTTCHCVRLRFGPKRHVHGTRLVSNRYAEVFWGSVRTGVTALRLRRLAEAIAENGILREEPSFYFG